jgi:hypothetical protein
MMQALRAGLRAQQNALGRFVRVEAHQISEHDRMRD